jgi:hypothetical protein
MGKSQRLPERKCIFWPRSPSAEAAKTIDAKAIGRDKRKLVFYFSQAPNVPKKKERHPRTAL